MGIFKSRVFKSDKEDVEYRIDIEPAALAHLSMLSEEERKAVHELLRSMSDKGMEGNVLTEKEYMIALLDDWYALES